MKMYVSPILLNSWPVESSHIENNAYLFVSFQPMFIFIHLGIFRRLDIILILSWDFYAFMLIKYIHACFFILSYEPMHKELSKDASNILQVYGQTQHII